MPRGNDPAAQSRLADKYGKDAGNADVLIQANAARFTREMRASGLLPVNEEATEALDVSKLATAVGADRGQIVAHAVRGEYATAVVSDSNGVVWKTAVPLEYAVQGKKFVSAVKTADDAERVTLNAEAAAAQKVADAQVKADQIVADAQAKAAQVVADEIAKATDEVRKAAQKAFREVAGEVAPAPVAAEVPAPAPRKKPAKSAE